jgi:rRNA maturation endonuclease Nob1
MPSSADNGKQCSGCSAIYLTTLKANQKRCGVVVLLLARRSNAKIAPEVAAAVMQPQQMKQMQKTMKHLLRCHALRSTVPSSAAAASSCCHYYATVATMK